MSRKIYITESQYNKFKTLISENWLTNNTMNNVIDSLGDYRSEREKKVESVVKTILGSNFTKNADDIKDIISKKLNHCINIENKNKELLEKLCADTIHSFIGDFQNDVVLTCNIVDKISNKNIIVHTSSNNKKPEFKNSSEISELSEYIEKRKSLLYIIIGASLVFTKYLLKKNKAELNNIDGSLYKNYKDILWLNEFLLLNNAVKVTDKAPNQAGGVIVKLGDENNKTTIKSVALLYPFLLFETLKGFFELFISHSLPDDKELASYVMDKTDILGNEQDCMIIGPILWNNILSITDTFESTVIPQFMIKLSNASNHSLDEICLGTKDGKDILNVLLNDIKYENEYSDFEDRISLKRNNKTLVMDNEYMSPDELIDDEYEL